ncbi:MAG: sulfate ABC transporter substrate-binding protein [Deltaproteobacteria bacterium]|nr:sulfate ABC transporter substrate-binding protein [Deltaproteobacteria bacterium]
MLTPSWLRLASVTLVLLVADGCGSSGNASAPGEASLTLGAYTTPREVYGKKVIPAFRRARAKLGKGDVRFRESYLASGAQSRAIVAGFEADVAALSLDPDIEKLRTAKLIRHDWRAGPHAGIVSRSVVVIGVRAGNPHNIRDWADLARPGLKVLTPNVRTSGGAMWNVAAIYGAALRGHTRATRGDTASATTLLADVLRNVQIMDRSGRDSLLTFERGVGDAIITYENEILVGRAKGQRYEYVIPRSSIQIENPAAIVDAYVDRHGTRELARAFLAFLYTPEVQRAFAIEGGMRPVVPEVAAEVASRFPRVTDLFTVRDLGGWPALERALFASGAVYDRALEQSRSAAR